jgi:hypothetical protein
MYSQSCPNCRARLNFRDCVPMVYRGFGVCKYCCKPFQVKRRTLKINAVISGIVVVVLARSILDASLLECMIYSLVFMLVFQRFIDFFYALEAADDKLIR